MPDAEIFAPAAMALPLSHSWMLLDRAQHFERVWDDLLPDRADRPRDRRDVRGIGAWACDLRDNALTWSAETYDLFGYPRGARVSRADSVRQYSEPSRAAMERLRAHAIRHRRGFTLDAQIVAVDGVRKWIRLTAAPICLAGRVVALHGLKRDVSAEYGLDRHA